MATHSAISRTSPFAQSKYTPDFLPGDLPPHKYIDRILRVDQAGEFGAKRIYQGQLDMLSRSGKKEILQHMADQEQIHLDYFNQAIADAGTRPSMLAPLWHAAGYALGALPALSGTQAAMAVTVAVEETIDAHYDRQIERLKQLGNCEELVHNIEKFQQEEQEHRDIGLAHDAQQAPVYTLLYWLVSRISKTSIAIAERI